MISRQRARQRRRSIFRTMTLVAAFVFVVLLPLSYWRYIYLARESLPKLGSELIVLDGSLVFFRFSNYGNSPPQQEWVFDWIPAGSDLGERLHAGFGTHNALTWMARRGFVLRIDSSNLPSVSFVTIMVPLWVIAVAFALPTAVHIVLSKFRVVPAGAMPCTSCGYDLRASPDRCPECGSANNAPAAGR